MRFRLKPTVFEAFEWDGKPDNSEHPPWFHEIMDRENGSPAAVRDGKSDSIWLVNKAGWSQVVKKGDYIVRSTLGDVWAVESQLLFESAEPIDEQA